MTLHSLFDRTLSVLEWHLIQGALQERTISPMGSALALTHQPRFEVARRALPRVQECIAIFSEAPFVRGLLADTSNPTDLFTRSQRDGVLEPIEIHACGHFMTTVSLVSKEMRLCAEYAPLLAKDFSTAPTASQLCELIRKSVSSEGLILDSASPELSGLRTKKSFRRAAFEKLLSSKVNSWHQEGLLQDKFYDVLDGRYVVPVRSDQQSKLTGNLYSRSQSRQSLFIEPPEFITSNNEIQEIEAQIRAEEYRILKSLSQKIKSQVPQFEPWIEAIAELDLTFASARLALDWKLTPPQLGGSELVLPQLFHPILPVKGVVPVSNSLKLNSQIRALLISGPNTGGKTVLLKGAALAVMMAHAGLYVATDAGAKIPHYTDIAALIGDEQNISEGLSSFSAQMKDLNGVTSAAKSPQLVVVDEILSSTDPEEASALAQAILEELVAKGHHVLITSHFSELSRKVRLIPSIQVGAMEFLDGKPTYRLFLDQCGSSHAIDIAERLGLSPHLIRRSRELMSQDRLEYEKALKDLQQKEIDLEIEHNSKSLILSTQFEEKELELHEERSRIRDHYRDFVDRSQEQIETALENLLKKWDSQLKVGQNQPQPSPHPQFRKDAQKLVERISQNAKQESQKISRPSRTSLEAPLPKPVASFAKGSIVRVKSLGHAKGEIIGLEGPNATIALGLMKISKPLRDLELIGFAKKRDIQASYEGASSLEKTSLDLRGQRYDTAMAQLETFLDRAFRARAPLVRVVTGHGTGALKAGLKELLKSLPYIKDFRPEQEGNDGALLIEFDLS